MKRIPAFVLLLTCICPSAQAVPVFLPPGGGQTFDGECAVPNVVGLSRSAGEGRLGQAKLTPRVGLRASDQPAGVIIDQQPKACAARPRDGYVNLAVSSGQGTREATAPRREGTSAGDVAVPIGIAVGAAVLGAILANRAERGDEEDTTTVPDLVKLPEGSLEATLRKSRLRQGETARLESLTAAAGTVIAQSPAAGTRVPPESTVSVQVSSGRPGTEVPDLTGLDWEEANARTMEARMRLIVTDPSAGDFAGLMVASQVPAAGTRVAVGAAVGVALRAPALPPVASPVVLQPAPAPQSPPPSPRPPSPTIQEPVPPASTTPAVPPVVPEPGVPALVGPATPPSVAAPAPAPAVPTVPSNGQGTVPVQPAPPPSPPTTWRWPWLLVLAAGIVLVIGRIHRRSSHDTRPSLPPPLPPIGPRIRCVPRLDAGRQVMTTHAREKSRTVSLIGHVDAGIQHLQSGSDSPQVLVQIGGRP